MTLPLASKLLTDAAAAIVDGAFDRAADLVEQAKTVEPQLTRKQRKLPRTIDELMPLLRRKEAAAPVLLQLRQSFGLSQQAMADICGVSQRNVAHWESGRQAISQKPIERLLKWIAEQGVSSLPDASPAAALVALRKALGLTQLEMASKLGIKESEVRRIEVDRLTPTMGIMARYRAIAGEQGLSL